MQDQPSHLFSPLRLRDVTLSNRIAVSPMCQYSAYDGLLNDWHFVHLGSRPTPRVMNKDDIERLQSCFAAFAQRAARAGFQVLELHAAHGYIFHQFLSPLSNRRTDAYGGSFENRARLLIETVNRVRDVWPSTRPLLVRIPATN